MGIMGDLLTASTPTRLVCRRGTWSLEVERLVAVERDVYQPRTQRLEGTDLVLQHLQRSANNALAHAAHTLIRGAHAVEECAFEALDSEWVPCEPKMRGESSRPGALAAANATVLELRAELCLLRAAHAGLRERLARLESQLATAARSRDASVFRSVGPVAPPQPDVTPSLPQASVARAATNAPSRPQPAPISPSLSPAKAVAAPATPDGSQPPAIGVSPLKLPSVSAVGVCLKTLIGKKIGLREARPATFPANSKHPCWFSPLIDDNGNDVGALVADLLAAISLGGALMMIPAAELDAQRAAQKPSEDVMSAMEEVMNNLSATINHAPDGLHVRVRALEPMADGNLAWTKAAAHALDLELDDGMGHLFLFAR